MKFKKIINEILCLAMAITMFSSGVVKVQAENINLALNKSVTASSDVSGQYSHLSPDKIVDGDTGTRWSAEASPIQWVVVDLGEVYEMNYFHIIWEGGSFNMRGSAYNIYVSESNLAGGEDWGTPVVTKTDNAEIESSDSLDVSVSGRYVKLEVTDIDGDYGNNVSVKEFEIYNVENESTTPVNTNLALKKPVGTNLYNVNDTAYLTDGKAETRMTSSTSDIKPTKENPFWAYVDLGAVYDMNYFSVLWESDSNYAKDFNIYTTTEEAINDDTQWTLVKEVANNTAGKTSVIELEKEVQGRYVKLEVTAVNGYPNVSACEFEVMLKDDSQQIPQDPEDNVALNKTGYSSSNETEGLNANKAFDGDTSTRDSRWSSKVGNAPHWVFVDLGETKDVKTIRIYWETRKATEYRIQVADTVTDTTTGEGNWKDVATLTERPSSTTDTITLTNVEKARYVRLYIDSFTSEDPDGSGSCYSISIYEMEVYGGTPAISMGDIGNMIKVETPTKDSEKLNVTLPEVEGYTVTYNGTDLEQVIDENLTIYTPVVDKTVKVSFKIVNNETKE